MKPYTNEDLKFLKRLIKQYNSERKDKRNESALGRLVGRLEAAEKALMADCECDPVSNHPDKCMETITWNKWRESIGAR